MPLSIDAISDARVVLPLDFPLPPNHNAFMVIVHF